MCISQLLSFFSKENYSRVANSLSIFLKWQEYFLTIHKLTRFFLLGKKLLKLCKLLSISFKRQEYFLMHITISSFYYLKKNSLNFVNSLSLSFEKQEFTLTIHKSTCLFLQRTLLNSWIFFTLFFQTTRIYILTICITINTFFNLKENSLNFVSSLSISVKR